jgi:DNA-binding LacI/PurR family transcriptional regulator
MARAERTKAATLADVARLAGVSAMTVSRVINDAHTVSEPTQVRVRKAMTQLRYRPNPLARGLARGRSHTIGVVTFDTGQYGPGSTLLSIERAARSRGYGVTIAAIERPDREAVRQAVLLLGDRLVDGLVVIAPFVDTAGALVGLDRSVPVVLAEAGNPSEAPVVGINQVQGARLATMHLLELGHQTVHHVAGPGEWIESRLRAQGWRQVLEEAGCWAPPTLDGDWTPAAGYQAGLRLAEDPQASAVFVANDQMALGLLAALHSRGIRVPDDLSVVGFDDTPESAFTTPALTTIRQDFTALGEAAMADLDRLINAEADVDDDPPPARLRLIAPGLVVRSSTGPPASGSMRLGS